MLIETASQQHISAYDTTSLKMCSMHNTHLMLLPLHNCFVRTNNNNLYMGA